MNTKTKEGARNKGNPYFLRRFSEYGPRPEVHSQPTPTSQMKVSDIPLSKPKFPLSGCLALA